MKIIACSLPVFAFLILSGCYDIAENTPECMVKKIKEYSKGGGCEDRYVTRYEFQEEIVYVFEPGTCGADMGADVFDSGCNLLGMLGGIAGNTTINGSDFSQAVLLETVWTKKK